MLRRKGPAWKRRAFSDYLKLCGYLCSIHTRWLLSFEYSHSVHFFSPTLQSTLIIPYSPPAALSALRQSFFDLTVVPWSPPLRGTGLHAPLPVGARINIIRTLPQFSISDLHPTHQSRCAASQQTPHMRFLTQFSVYMHKSAANLITEQKILQNITKIHE